MCALADSPRPIEVLCRETPEAIHAADHVVDMGPGAGEHGGEVVAQGTPAEIERDPASLTGLYLTGRRAIAIPARRRRADAKRVVRVAGARGNNLKDVTVELPVGLFDNLKKLHFIFVDDARTIAVVTREQVVATV